MTFSIHKTIFASITLLLTFIAAFVFPAVNTHIASAGQVHQEDVKTPLEAPQFTRASTVQVVASVDAKLNFERAAVKTIPAGPTPEEIATEKARVEKEAADKAATEKAATEKVEAEKKAAVAEKAAQEQTLYYAEVNKPAGSGAASANTTAGSSPAAMPAAGDTSVAASKAFARATLAARGMGDGEFQCLNNLWERESNWNYRADNPSSDAFGIPQSLPGSKMASIAPDWETNPQTQILWGIGYISERYGTPCNAWGHSQSIGWY